MIETAFINGRLLQPLPGDIAGVATGLRRGCGVFETLRSYDGKLFRLSEHLHRLRSGADFLGLTVPAILLMDAVVSTMEAAGRGEARLNIYAAAGTGNRVEIVVTAREYRPPLPEEYRHGLKAFISSIRRNQSNPLTRYKTLNQHDNQSALAQARRHGAAEAIFLNDSGEAAETNRGNLFIIKKGAVTTPPPGAGILPGITRSALAACADSVGIELKEGRISRETLENADEVFITSSMVEVMPISAVNGRPVGNGAFPVSHFLHRALSAFIRSRLD